MDAGLIVAGEAEFTRTRECSARNRITATLQRPSLSRSFNNSVSAAEVVRIAGPEDEEKVAARTVRAAAAVELHTAAAAEEEARTATVEHRTTSTRREAEEEGGRSS